MNQNPKPILTLISIITPVFSTTLLKKHLLLSVLKTVVLHNIFCGNYIFFQDSLMNRTLKKRIYLNLKNCNNVKVFTVTC